MIHMVLCARRSTRCGVVEQIVADPVPQILDGVQHVPRERVQNPVGKQMVDVPVPQIREEIVELVSATLVRTSGDSTGGRAQIEQIVDVPVPQIWEQSVEVIKVILQQQCQRMRFFLLTACGKGAVGGTVQAMECLLCIIYGSTPPS